MVAVGTMAVASSSLVRRFGYPLVFGVGATIAAAGMFAFSRASADGSLMLVIVASALIGAGIAPMMTLATDVVVSSSPAKRSGAASALSETASEFGAAMGIAVLGSIGSALYRSNVLEGIPRDVPTEAADAITSSLGAALGVAEQLPAEAAEHLTALASQAFVDGLAIASIAGSGFLVIAAIACPVLLHRGRSPGPRR